MKRIGLLWVEQLLEVNLCPLLRETMLVKGSRRQHIKMIMLKAFSTDVSKVHGVL